VAVRVKLRIKSRLEAGVEVETVALVNSVLRPTHRR
jgi:hypothetical protein